MLFLLLGGLRSKIPLYPRAKEYLIGHLGNRKSTNKRPSRRNLNLAINRKTAA